MDQPAQSKLYEDGYDPKYGYNRNAFAHKTPATAVLGKIGQLITTPIGLASEAIAHRKEQRRLFHVLANGQAEVTKEQDVEPARGDVGVITDSTLSRQSFGLDDGTYYDVADWALDEAAADLACEQPATASTTESTSSVSSSPQATPRPTSRLLYPVVLPQRRPRTKTRGFIRAYAPVLSGAGVSQDAFMTFLESLHTASQSSQLLKVIQISAGLAGLYPDLIVASVAQAIQVTAGVAQEMQERWKTNKFLDNANATIFMPRGLYCMIVKYRRVVSGDDFVSTETIDAKAVEGIAKYGDHLVHSGSSRDEETSLTPAMSAPTSDDFDNLKDKLQNRLHLASAESKGPSELPVECAPLIFPALEARAPIPNASVIQSVTSRAQRSNAFVADYFDRRARMLENTTDPGNPLNELAGGTPTFSSKMGDPRDARNTHLITLLTGGLIKAEPLGARGRWEKAQAKEAARLTRAREERAADFARGKAVGPMLVKKRFLQEDILYLLVVNMPSELELVKARAMLAGKEKTRG